MEPFEKHYQARLGNDLISYWEDRSASSRSNVLLMKQSATGDVIWRAEAVRSCSMGISRCFLILPYDIGEPAPRQIEAQMNYIHLGGQSYLLLSHLNAMIAHLYIKGHPTASFKLVGYAADADLQGADYDLPDLFENVCNRP